ncbi:MAG: hypothetical protein IJN53_01135 [Oscillospiraceae bacterium]|nr:hypothetical protein [Oscillospiraceae bacterium]
MKKQNKIVLLALLAVVFVALVVAAIVLGTGSNKDGGNPHASAQQKQTTPNSSDFPMNTTPGETTVHQETLDGDNIPTVEIQDQAQGSYEQWLAAAAYNGGYMLHMEANQMHIYVASETDMANKADSLGVYLSVEENGVQYLYQCLPLEEERTQAGTVDLSTQDLGYATFDAIEIGSVDLSGMTELNEVDLQIYIDQTMLPTLTIH